jgi:hypothetical protein
MARKLVLSLVAIAVFFSFSLRAAASPIEAPATASPYATASTLARDPGTDFLPVAVVAAKAVAKAAAPYVASFAVGIASGLAANYVYDAIKGSQIHEAPTLDPQAELIFDY